MLLSRIVYQFLFEVQGQFAGKRTMSDAHDAAEVEVVPRCRTFDVWNACGFFASGPDDFEEPRTTATL